MNKLILIIVSIIALMFMACGTGVQVKPVQPCIVDVPTADGKVEQIEFNAFCDKVVAEGKASFICGLREEHNLDACYLHRGMEVVSKEGLVLEGYTFEEFETWANKVKSKVEAGLTYGLLRDLVLAQFTKINRMLGAQMLILGDMFLELPQDELIPESDITLVVSSIDDLVQEVKTLDIWLN